LELPKGGEEGRFVFFLAVLQVQSRGIENI
jgi:hypothetical protein